MNYTKPKFKIGETVQRIDFKYPAYRVTYIGYDDVSQDFVYGNKLQQIYYLEKHLQLVTSEIPLKYIVVHSMATSIGVEVNKKIAEGYTPQGGVSFYGNYAGQAMVLSDTI